MNVPADCVRNIVCKSETKKCFGRMTNRSCRTDNFDILKIDIDIYIISFNKNVTDGNNSDSLAWYM